jgi:hypothetical protein
MAVAAVDPGEIVGVGELDLGDVRVAAHTRDRRMG